MIQRSPLWETLVRERMLFNLEMAVARYQRIESASPHPGVGEPA